MHKWSINVTPAERIARVMIGLAGVISGAYVLTAGATVVTAVLAVLLILAGLDLVVTGATGHYPAVPEAGIRPGLVEGRNIMTNEERRDPHPGSTVIPKVMADLRAVVVTIVTAG